MVPLFATSEKPICHKQACLKKKIQSSSFSTLCGYNLHNSAILGHRIFCWPSFRSSCQANYKYMICKYVHMHVRKSCMIQKNHAVSRQLKILVDLNRLKDSLLHGKRVLYHRNLILRNILRSIHKNFAWEFLWGHG